MTQTDNTQPVSLVSCGVFTFKKPTRAAWISSIFLIGLCVYLGCWQLQRLEWKQVMITKVESGLKERAVTVSDLPDDLTQMDQFEFRKVILPGNFEHTHEFHLAGRRSDQGEPGFDVVTPFRIAENGGLILVNRGWVPSTKKEPKDRTEDARFDGILLVSGMLVKPSPAPILMPENNPETNVWLVADIDMMSKIVGEKLPPVVLETINASPPPGSLPIPRADGTIELRNDHLSYAWTWFSLAFAGLAIFFIYHLHSMKGDEDEKGAAA